MTKSTIVRSAGVLSLSLAAVLITACAQPYDTGARSEALGTSNATGNTGMPTGGTTSMGAGGSAGTTAGSGTGSAGAGAAGTGASGAGAAGSGASGSGAAGSGSAR